MNVLKKPKFILFDYGQTLIREDAFDGARGYDELLRHAVSNPQGVTGTQLQHDAEELNRELGRCDPVTRHKRLTECSEESFIRFLLTRRCIELEGDLRHWELPFWNAANPCEATDGAAEFLDWLGTQGIGTGVVSNLSFCGETLRRRIEGCLPGASFAFVISSCDYLFRKPSPHIFEAALAKAGVPAEDVWFCGDQFIPDLEGSAAAGMTPVWYRAFLRYDQECALKTGLQVDSWEELRGIMEALEP
ncbi:MAG: HAD family hydrolase [Clostridia bacterium]|nr:HAD family hydrolase [Clostridia bacterium]